MVIGLPLGMFALMWASGSSPSLMKLYFIGMIAALLGLYLPSLWIRRRPTGASGEIINGFPDALDLMLVCVEAGLGLEAAFSRVGMEMTRSHPLLAEQLGAVVLELRAGRSQEDALRRMADRAGADEIRAFATLLIQSHKLGSSIAQTLRIYAVRNARAAPDARRGKGAPAASAAVDSAGGLHAAGDDRRADAASGNSDNSRDDSGHVRGELNMKAASHFTCIAAVLGAAACSTGDLNVRPIKSELVRRASAVQCSGCRR